MALKAAAQRKTFKGQYKGPDRFKGDKAAIAAWKADKKDNPNPGMKTETAMTFPGDSNYVAPAPAPVKPEKPAEATNTFNPGTATAVGAKVIPGFASATRKFKGTYAGPDKYKGLAPAGGKWKGKYIGAEKRKGKAKPTVAPSNAGALEDAVRKFTS